MKQEMVVLIEPDPSKDGVGWRAELWVRPYVGWMVACTRWTTKSWAVRDARRIFKTWRLFGRE